MTQPILDLTTLIERPRVAIDGQIYEMLAPDELSVLESQRVWLLGRELEKALTPDGDAARADELVAELSARVMPDLPAEVRARLRPDHHLAIAQVFTGLLLRRRMSVAEATVTAMKGHPQTTSETIPSRSIGGPSSPGSSGSMAAAPAPGWWKRLWAWCGRI